MLKSEKPIFVDNLSEQLKEASAVVLLDYTGLTVKLQQDLKNKLREIGAEMSIIKNTLLGRAGKDAKMPEEVLTDTVLSGPTALIISKDDPIAPLQVIAKFAKDNEILQMKVGVIDGKFQDKAKMEKLSLLPAKNVLFGQVVGTIAQPMYGLVGTLQGNLQKLIWILSEKAKVN